MPTTASSSRVQLSYIKESIFGVTPVTGNGTKLRATGESLTFDINKDTSKEIRDDRQVSGMVPISAQASGGIPFHMQYKEYDPFIEAALQSTFAAYGTAGVGATFTAAMAANTITASAAPTGNSAFTTLQRGQWFRFVTTGTPSDPNNGKLFRVSPTVAPTSTVITLDPATPATVAASLTNSLLQTSRLTNGVTQPSFTIEESFADIGQFLAYRGQTVSKLSLQFASESLTNGTLDFMGKDAVSGVVTTLPGTPAASQTFDVHNAATGIGQIWEGGAPLTSTFIKSLSLNIDNSLRAKTAIGTLGSVDIGSGSFNVTGSFEAYFATGALYQKFLQNTSSMLSWSSQDAAGNGYVFTLPNINLSKAAINAGGMDQDVMVQVDFTAIADLANATPALQKTIFIDRVGV
ncbi:phage tail tube protein [Cupriavidus basilensis]|uniref:phage tail tube protein n=1 Tax=Cupriavidus basilensis TaxID=68895 RepID=UPI0020A69F01|nr:phage tail tube protein [Cupriavidus basilensis]MCP3023264.1 phage tail tube protein [Cupriavidus basilensis]